jgi:hypothetical protein
MVYMCLFGSGKLLLHQPGVGVVLLVGSVICAFLLYHSVIRNFKVEPEEALSGTPDWVETPVTSSH